MRDLDRLRLFQHLSRSLHFGRTSQECHVSPSALTRAVQALEHDVGVELFERDRRSVRLTAAGEVLQAFVGRVFADWQATEQALHAERATVAGSLSIYCTVTAAQTLVPRLLGRFRADYPDVHIGIETGYAADALDRVVAESVDVAVAPLPERLPRGVIALELVRTPLVFVAPTAHGSVSDAVEGRIDWSTVPVVLPAGGLARRYVDRWFQWAGVQPRIDAAPQGHEAVLSLVALGCGVGVVPRLVLDGSALRSEVRVVDVDPPLPVFRIALAARTKAVRDDPVVSALWATAPTVFGAVGP